MEGLRLSARRDGRPVELVHGIDLAVERGRVTALVGASGSGKSLTCLGLQGLAPPGVERLAGRVRLDGVAVEPAALPGRVVATVMQNPRSAFNPVLTMRAHARETLALRGDAGALDERLAEALAEVGLPEPGRVARLHPFEMSGGMLQRMMIALALLAGVPFLLADEPTTDLDPLAQAHILTLIERLVATRGLGVLIVTHDMGVVARLADDVAVMEAGRIVETAPVADLFAAPRSGAARALLAAHRALYPEEVA
ncbi:nickel import ATP-binding protein NikD (plasmid) [Azospirillum thermophilum]|uniref:Nickel import ATP-binding protein NikD n=1 Tax=Azospirillum thermophilum TaxID=2202148 RepID=A0A2S2CYR9_9PROT|nr:ATP-binding cassette domain-containing protein [Azospirillum thermophilum]AWK89626.1 nickel import ATP-binding protein NikD [Azospirillum thermophilum]